ncbi:GNAT family N-acetyltransferase [Chryseobacterium sp.]|uniref:GNAT family N-acetyltransferase n=1 Tax=Chryseobacterium sp. TaxID=1871047 RepID=UPI00289FD63B|nr:GNAT family N-acetyltransferase [Chryseobacterium sp.]
MSLKKHPSADNTYETERLILRPMSPLEDRDFVFDLYNRPKFVQYIGNRNVNSAEDAENYILNRFAPQIEKLGFGNYLLVTKEGNEKIGAVGIFQREGLEILDIGYSLLEEFEGKGYAFEAAQKVKSIALDDFGLSKISAIISKDNISSQKLIEKLGLRFKKHVILPGETEELNYYETE